MNIIVKGKDGKLHEASVGVFNSKAKRLSMCDNRCSFLFQVDDLRYRTLFPDNVANCSCVLFGELSINNKRDCMCVANTTAAIWPWGFRVFGPKWKHFHSWRHAKCSPFE